MKHVEYVITWTNYLISDIYCSFCETKSWKKTHQGIETDLYLFEFGIGAGTWCFCTVGFAEGLHSNNSLFLRVCSKVFNLSLPFSFLSLSLWLCYYKITWILCVEVVHSQYSIFHDYARLVMNFYENALDWPHPPPQRSNVAPLLTIIDIRESC